MAEFSPMYLGSVPVGSPSSSAIRSAVTLLLQKLAKLNSRLIKHLSTTQQRDPAEVAATLTARGMDCTMGEQIVLRFTSETIELCEPDSIESTEIFLKAITAHSRIVLDKKRTSQELYVIIEGHNNGGEISTECHVFGLTEDITISNFASAIDNAVRSADASSSKAGPSSGRSGSGSRVKVEQNKAGGKTITFGIGLNRKSSLKVSRESIKKKRLRAAGGVSLGVARDKSLRGNPTSRPVSSGMEAMVATLGAMSVAQPTEEVQRGDSAGNFVACDEEVYSGFGVVDAEEDNLSDDEDFYMMETQNERNEFFGFDSPSSSADNPVTNSDSEVLYDCRTTIGLGDRAVDQNHNSSIHNGVGAGETICKDDVPPHYTSVTDRGLNQAVLDQVKAEALLGRAQYISSNEPPEPPRRMSMAIAPEPPRRRSYTEIPEPPRRMSIEIAPEPPRRRSYTSSVQEIAPEPRRSSYIAPEDPDPSRRNSSQTFAAPALPPPNRTGGGGSGVGDGTVISKETRDVTYEAPVQRNPNHESSDDEEFGFNDERSDDSAHPPWLYHSMGKEEAETLLLTCSHQLGLGSFLVRESESRAGAYTLTLLVRLLPPSVSHIRLLKRAHGAQQQFTIQERSGQTLPWFSTMSEMVDHFKKRQIPGLKSQGVPSGMLGNSCNKNSRTNSIRKFVKDDWKAGRNRPDPSVEEPISSEGSAVHVATLMLAGVRTTIDFGRMTKTNNNTGEVVDIRRVKGAQWEWKEIWQVAGQQRSNWTAVDRTTATAINNAYCLGNEDQQFGDTSQNSSEGSSQKIVYDASQLGNPNLENIEYATPAPRTNVKSDDYATPIPKSSKERRKYTNIDDNGILDGGTIENSDQPPILKGGKRYENITDEDRNRLSPNGRDRLPTEGRRPAPSVAQIREILGDKSAGSLKPGEISNVEILKLLREKNVELPTHVRDRRSLILLANESGALYDQ